MRLLAKTGYEHGISGVCCLGYLALVCDEPGLDVVARCIESRVISVVDVCKVITERLRRDIPVVAALELLSALHVDIHPHGRHEAIATEGL